MSVPDIVVDLILAMGQNLGTSHPHMLSVLEPAKAP